MFVLRSRLAACGIVASFAIAATTFACSSSVNPSDFTSDDSGTGADTNGSDNGVGSDSKTPTDTATSSDTAPGDGSTCVAPKKLCSGRCVDTDADNSNCGSCGNSCSAGTVCTLGICKCPSTSVTCGSACVDLSSDPSHCGGCDKACAGGETCVSGKCSACPSDKPTVCGAAPGVCTDTITDVENCGACGKKCTTGASCSGGACMCPTSLVDCGTGCVDLSSDKGNCGGCGKTCASGASCVSGTCKCPSSKPVACGDKCVDESSDPNNCGGCGVSCGSGTCVSGACVCGSGQIKCGSSCVDPSKDGNNCGGCGVACATTGSCVSGHCTIPKCKGGGVSVLFYGPTASATTAPEQAYLPAGSTRTIASETTWRSMTTADFQKYDLIVIGEPAAGGGPASTDLQAAFDTRATWSAAVNGRIVVLGMDPAYHAGIATTGAQTFLKATLAWLSTSAPKTTSLYVSPDWGRRNLDYLGAFGAFTSTSIYGQTISIDAPAHPILVGSTATTLSNWSQSAHDVMTFPATFSAVLSSFDSFSDVGVPTPVAVARDGGGLCGP